MFLFLQDFLRSIEAREAEIEEITAGSVAASRATTKERSRSSTANKVGKKIKTKKRKKAKSSQGNFSPNSEGRGYCLSREQEEADFAEEMRVQFRPFDADTNLTDRPLSRHDKASSREGRSEEKTELGGNMANMFSAGARSDKPVMGDPGPSSDVSGTSSPKDTFQNVPLDEVGKNSEFYQRRPKVADAGGDTDEYDEDTYEDEFDD